MKEPESRMEVEDRDIVLRPIGVIHTPYQADRFVPEQPLEREEGESRLELRAEFAPALQDLAAFSHLYVLYYFHLGEGGWQPVVAPPWAQGKQVGLFSSRSPARPNRLGLSLVRLREVRGATLVTSLLDVYDGTPLLDVKPYLRGLDCRPEANNGWVEQLPDPDHILEHLRGVSHDHHHPPHGHHHHQPRHHHHDGGSGPGGDGPS
jgi:tRNA (adenine37-N6)-methyltransferase